MSDSLTVATPTAAELTVMLARTAKVHRYCSGCWPRDGRYIALCGKELRGTTIREGATCAVCVVEEQAREGCTGTCGVLS